jgi:hypothetical protein
MVRESRWSVAYCSLTHLVARPPYFLPEPDNRDGIFKLLRSPGIDSKELIPPAYVAWRAGTTALFPLGS